MRRLRRAVVIVATVLGAACGGDAGLAPLPAEGAPASFRVGAAWYGYGSLSVTLRDGVLVVVRSPDWDAARTTTTTVVPTDADWAAFWDSARRAKLDAWPRSCVDTRLVDGGGISVDIVHAGGRIEASTSNAYPQGDGTCVRGGIDPTGEYMEFMGAMSRLIGRSFP